MNNFQAAVWKEDTWYVSQCLNVDVASQGKTKVQALRNLREAVALYLEDAPKKSVSLVSRAELVSLA